MSDRFDVNHPRLDYISTHVKPYSLIYSLLPLDPIGGEAHRQIYTKAPADKPLGPATRCAAPYEVRQIQPSQWRAIFNRCDGDEEKLALLFERKKD